MSLVAYTASDESASDDEKDTQLSKQHNDTTKPEIQTIIGKSSTGFTLSALPKPKSKTLNQGFGNDVVEEKYKKKPTGLVLPPPAKSKTRQPMKISAPVIEPDSDDEDNEPKVKKFKPKGKSGLTSMLPQPKNVTTKESGRSLIPHTLTKKPAAPKQLKKKTTKVSSTDSDDDTEDTDVVGESTSTHNTNFFSLDEQSNKAMYDDKHTALTANLNVNLSDQYTVNKMVKSDSEDTSGKDDNIYGNAQQITNMNAYPDQYNDTVYNNISDQDYYNQQYNAEQDYTTQQAQSTGVQELLNDEQFMRMAGKKKGKREEINIVDVNADDAIGPVNLEITKGISEEKSTFRPSNKKGAGPSGQSKRKHQITYLAYQAKARELDLKNQWAENRVNRRAAQSKYGF